MAPAMIDAESADAERILARRAHSLRANATYEITGINNVLRPMKPAPHDQPTRYHKPVATQAISLKVASAKYVAVHAHPRKWEGQRFFHGARSPKRSRPIYIRHFSSFFGTKTVETQRNSLIRN
jgi:hypothetical protein